MQDKHINNKLKSSLQFCSNRAPLKGLSYVLGPGRAASARLLFRPCLPRPPVRPAHAGTQGRVEPQDPSASAADNRACHHNGEPARARIHALSYGSVLLSCSHRI